MPKTKKTLYHDSLAVIFLKSGTAVFFPLLLVCIFVLFFLSDRSDAFQLMAFLFVFLVVFSYTLPLLSLFKVWEQERTLGISWKDRTDQDQPAWEQDWYLDLDRGGFTLCHRDYIKRILGSRVVQESVDHNSCSVHLLRFEDVCGKTHTIKFSSASLEKNFRRWYQKEPPKSRKKSA